MSKIEGGETLLGEKCLGPSMVGDVHAFLDSLPSVQFYEPDVDLIFKKIH